MAMDRGPLKVGVTYAGESLSSENTEVARLQVSKAATLQNLTGEYVFYTPALIHIGVRLAGNDPYNDFLAEQGATIGRISIRFNNAIFKGLDLGKDREWNYVLYGMPKEYWDAFVRFMGSVAFHDRDLDLLTRIRTQDIEIADPLYFEHHTILPDKCPTVGITVFALDTNRGCTYVRTGTHPLLDVPRVVFTSESFDDTLVFAQAMEDPNDPNPYTAIEQSQGVDLQTELEERFRKEKEKQKNATRTDPPASGT